MCLFIVTSCCFCQATRHLGPEKTKREERESCVRRRRIDLCRILVSLDRFLLSPFPFSFLLSPFGL